MLKPIRRLVFVLVGLFVSGIYGNVLMFLMGQSIKQAIHFAGLGFLAGLLYGVLIPRRLKLLSLRITNRTASQKEIEAAKFQTYAVIIGVSLLHAVVYDVLKVEATTLQGTLFSSLLAGCAFYFLIYALMNYQEVIKPPEP